MMDKHSSFPVTKMITGATAEDIKEAIIDGWFPYFGPPKKIMTDQGTNFLCPTFKKMAKQFWGV